MGKSIKILLDPDWDQGSILAAIRRVTDPTDEIILKSASDILNTGVGDGIDVAIVNVCGTTPLARVFADARIPCLAVHPCLTFHPFHAAFCRDVERMGGILLPSAVPEDIASSLQAVHGLKDLRAARLMVVSTGGDGFRNEENDAFAQCCRERLGVEIVQRRISELKARAASFNDQAADLELKRWYAEVLEGPGEMTQNHMRQVARLYLAEREMIIEAGASGITVEDIDGFRKCNETMPNVSYGVLAFDGILAAEEGDIVVLASELLLKTGLAAHPTMSNIYIGYRGKYDSVSNYAEYTHDMHLEDYRACIKDNHVMAAHFSYAGVLPPNMMVEPKYRVVEALPGWPGDSMTASTPKLGPAAMLRLSQDAFGAHLMPGTIDMLGQGDKQDGLRGRWFIKIPSTLDFVARCLHPHYAIGHQNDRYGTLKILLEQLLHLKL